MKEFENKRIILTGASSGIGHSLLKYFINEGAIVYATSRNKRELTKEDEQKCNFELLDLANENNVKKYVKGIMENENSIDILINNAILQPQDRNIWEVDELFWDKVMNLSLKAYFFGAKRAAKHMISQGNGGKIISLASVHAYAAMPDWPIYGVAKSGIIRMAKGLSVDLRGTVIKLN